jgi:hypothetical protein
MMVRETLNKHKGVAAAVAVVLLGAGVALAIWANGSGIPGPLKRAYYSDDDGKTYFADDFDKIYPFDHNGKQAYRASVCQCSSGKPFVLYLQRLTDSTKSQLMNLSSKANDPEVAATIANLRSNGIELKKPGGTKWISPANAGPEDAITPSCPGGGVAREIYP